MTQKVRILVAEDEALIRMDLVEMLQGAGYEVVAEATNGQEAIDLANEHKPDLAILKITRLKEKKIHRQSFKAI